MNSMLPIVTVSDLQRSTKSVLQNLNDFVVVQSHGKDVALLLHPDLGNVLLKLDMFHKLLEMCGKKNDISNKKVDFATLDKLIGNVLLELSKK